MKVTEDGDRIVIEMTRREAYKAWNHIEYSTRLDWLADVGDGELRSLNRERQCEPFGQRNRGFGLAETRRLSESLKPFVDGLWLNERGELEAM